MQSPLKFKLKKQTKYSPCFVSLIVLQIYSLTYSPVNCVSTIQSKQVIVKDELKQQYLAKICQIDSSKHVNGFLYTYEADECSLSCYILTTSSSLRECKMIFYDESVKVVHHFDKRCRDSVHHCEEGQCKPMTGQLQVIIYTVKHDHNDIEGSTIDPGDVFIEIEVNNETKKTQTLHNTYEGSFNTRPFVFDNVKADDTIYLIAKDEDAFFHDYIDDFRLTPAEIIQKGANGLVQTYSKHSSNYTLSIETLITFTPKAA